MKRKSVLVVAAIVIGIALFLAFIVNLLFKLHSSGLIAAEWSAGDALAYIGAILGSASSFVLGYIAYKQNDKLQTMEENNYIANNCGMLLVKQIHAIKTDNIPVNYELHDEQILTEKKTESYISSACKIEVSGIRLGNNIPALVRVNKAMISAGGKDNPLLLTFANRIQEGFSRIAIGEESLRFNVLLLLEEERKKKLDQALTGHGDISIEFEFIIVTDKCVATTCKCRSLCKHKIISKHFMWFSEEPMVFFYGNEMLSKEDLKYAGENTR